MKNLKRIRNMSLGIILVISTFCSSIPVFACEQSTEANNDIVEITDPTEIKNAIELLGLSEDEADGATFYAADVEVLGRGTHQMPAFNLSTYTRGNDRIFNGDKLSVNVVIQGSQYSHVYMRFCNYQQVMWTADLGIEYNENSAVYRSGWFDIRYGGTYFMTYDRYGGEGSIKITVIYGVY